MKWLLPEPNDPDRNAARLWSSRTRRGYQTQRLVERLGEGVGDDVLGDGAGQPAAAHALGQAQHVVFRTRRLGDVDHIAQQGTHAVAAFRARGHAGTEEVATRASCSRVRPT